MLSIYTLLFKRKKASYENYTTMTKELILWNNICHTSGKLYRIEYLEIRKYGFNKLDLPAKSKCPLCLYNRPWHSDWEGNKSLVNTPSMKRLLLEEEGFQVQTQPSEDFAHSGLPVTEAFMGMPNCASA